MYSPLRVHVSGVNHSYRSEFQLSPIMHAKFLKAKQLCVLRDAPRSLRTCH